MQTKVTSEEQLTDAQGWAYRAMEMRPRLYFAPIMDKLYKSELAENLDWRDLVKLASYIDNGADWENATDEELWKLQEQCDEAYQGDYNSEADFAEQYTLETGLVSEDAIQNVVIDWQGTYNYSLQWDFWNAWVFAKNEKTNELHIFNFFFRNY